MTRLPRILAALAVFLFAGAALFAPVSASARPGAVSAGVEDFSFSSYDADFYLSRDTENHATLTTVETFVAKFPSSDQNRGIIRAIPNDYDGVPLNTAVTSVTDASGAAVHYDTTTSNGFTELALGTDDYVHGEQSYVITYTQQNVVRHFADTNDDELYWDTNGTGFDQPFGRVTARVHVDPSITSFLTDHDACYRGAEGSTDTYTCDITRSTDTDAAGALFTASTTGLEARQNLTVAIGFTSDTFVQVPAETQPGDSGPAADPPWWSNLVAWLLAAIAAAGGVFAVLRRTVLGPQDSRGRGITIPQYSPPKGLNLMEAAALVRRTGSGFAAQFVSFAVRGNVRILDYPLEKDDGDYTLQFLHADNVDDDENRLLRELFGDGLPVGATRALGVVDDTLAGKLSAIQSGVGARLISRGLRAKVSSIGGVVVMIAAFLLLFLSIGLTVLFSALGAFSPWLILAIAISFILIFVAAGVAVRPAVLTDAGADQRDYLLGVRDYLQLAEADRFRMLQSPQGAERIDVGDKVEMVKLYEKLLPFAVLWGIEREWAKELAVYYDAGVRSPGWYVSSGTFNSLIFAQTLGGFSSSVTTTSTPTPSPSSWSGSSGGSFSGGSFGGGFSGGGGGGGGGGGR
ncbi:DUF2207 domain-containing protein [Glaciihabitans sp. UYNi722]|uniref:DUF2207 domain-containing protein n=1 Tax=Glaciihabitans sp. UYNi722 TaxID=3156344 RepID=UPI003392CA9D